MQIELNRNELLLVLQGLNDTISKLGSTYEIPWLSIEKRKEIGGEIEKLRGRLEGNLPILSSIERDSKKSKDKILIPFDWHELNEIDFALQFKNKSFPNDINDNLEQKVKEYFIKAKENR